jgi:signal transduction histidine kinase
MLEQYGMERDFVLSAPPEALIGEPHTFDEAIANIARALREGKHDFEWNMRRSDRSVAPVEVRLRRLPGFRGGEDEPAVVAVVRDLTEQRRVEAQLLERAKLQSLASVAGGVAHDFNNFLTAVLGALSLAMQQLREEHRIRPLLEDAVEGATRARGLTRQLLAYARGGASVPSVFALPPLIDQTVRLALAGTAVTTRIEIAPELRPVRADRAQIALVFHNLFLNAVQAMPAGELSVRAEDVAVDESDPALAPGRYVRIEVADSGPGIDPEDLPRIFDPFFTTKSEGSGLGLPTAFAVVRRHGGQLSVRSRAGEGATFTVILPACDDEPSRQTSRPPPKSRGLRVLVLEDEPGLRRVLVRMLDELDHEALEAEHGDGALELARAERGAGRAIDVALLDLTIRGGRGGREILSELRAILPSAVIVGMSGYSDVAPSEVPFDAFLPKPFGFERFESLLHAVSGHRGA